jgi:hypothetical protein
LKPRTVLIFQPAWACKEVLKPLIDEIKLRGASVVVVENPTQQESLAQVYRHNLHQVAPILGGNHQVVGLGISQGSHALSQIARTTEAEGMKGIVLYGSPMLSKRPTLKSLMVLLRIILTPAYWGIFWCLFDSTCKDISLKRKDVVELLFGEDRTEWKDIIDAVSKQKAPPAIMLEMLIGDIRRVTYNMPVRVLRASEEVFHSNSGALAWLKKKPHYHARDAYRIIRGHHFGALVDKASAAEIAQDVMSLFD